MSNVKNKPLIIGLTGGIASGKSTATAFLKQEGFLVFDSDLAVKEIWQHNKQAIDYVKNKYDIEINTNLGKQQLAKLLFTNPSIQKDINNLIHPIVFEMIENWINNNFNHKILIIDMPLLIESKYYLKVDQIILIYCDKDTQIKRLINRNNLTEEEALKRINAQLSLEEKKLYANYIINNNKTITYLYDELKAVMEEIKNEVK